MQICRHFGICGGCLYQDIPYQQQLELKEQETLELLKKNNIIVGEFMGIQGSDRIYGYRNKMEFTFGDEFKGGEMTLGMHKQKHFMSIVTADQCNIVDGDFNRILAATLEFFREKGYAHYNKKTHQGFQRNLIIRKGERSGELLINLVSTDQSIFEGQEFVEVLLSLELKSKIVGILHTFNNSVADFVYSDRIEILFGRDYYMEEVSGLKFKVSAFSFFQTNVPAIEKLYGTALDYIDDLKDATVFDLYSGTGTIAQTAARMARRSIGIELVEEAVLSARANAEMNGLENCMFVCGDVLEMLDKIEEKPDVIVLDPPRAGIHPKALNKILDYQVKQIIYISCNPKTMAANLTVMQDFGYRTEKLKLFDNFPHTKHVETVVLMSRVKK